MSIYGKSPEFVRAVVEGYASLKDGEFLAPHPMERRVEGYDHAIEREKGVTIYRDRSWVQYPGSPAARMVSRCNPIFVAHVPAGEILAYVAYTEFIRRITGAAS